MIDLLGKHEEVDIGLIDVDDNRRPLDPDYVEVIRTSIQARGLINPITLYHPTSRPRYKLLAGRHRYHACKALGLERISARVYDTELGPHELKAIEIVENLHRKDLTEIERAQHTHALHELMQGINGPARAGRGGHGIRDTAKLLGRSAGTVHSDIKLAEAIRALPELGLDKMPNKITAQRVLQRFGSAILNQQTAQRAEQATPADHWTQGYRLGDFFANDLPDAAFGCIECDPPYGIDLASSRHRIEKGLHDLRGQYNEIDASEYSDFISRLAHECWRLAAPNSWLILWHGPQWYQMCCDALTSAGWNVVPVPAIWKKGNNPGQSMAPDSALGNSYEPFIYARKGSPKLRVLGRSNIFDYPPVPGNKPNRHPTERPVSLIQDILNTFSWPGIPVLCPFMGSGATLVACHQLRMPCVGYDLSEQFRNSFLALHAKED